LSDLLDDLVVRTGHFRFESGHHGDLWLELDALFADPIRTERLAAAMIDRLGGRGIEVVCGPMSGGALLALTIARPLAVTFAYTERVVADDNTIRYVLPEAQHALVSDKRIAIVDDVIYAGSATGGTFHALVSAGARPVAIGALLVLGSAIDRFAQSHSLPLLACARRESNLWTPESCPLCASGIPLKT
jgi:orotate phosphoribosyltransferase